MRQSLLVAVVAVVGFGHTLPVHAAAFSCPETAAAGIPGTDPSLGGLYAGADDVTALNRLWELMADLRKRGLKPALIVDRLIGAYCPLVVADDTLSDAQKTDRVRRFARLVTGMAYGPQDANEVDVLVETTLTPSLLSQIDQAALQAGLSRNEWIERAIKRQLAVP